MTIESLLYFVEIAKGSTFMEAADKYNISQSALSKAIMRLEEEIGLPLLDRSGRSAKLTDKGGLIYPDMVELCLCYNKLIRRIQVLKKDTRLRAYVIPSHTTLGLSTILRDFLTLYPDISVDLSVLKPKDMSLPAIKDQIDNLLKLLSIGNLDCIIMHRPNTLDENIEVTTLHDDYYLVLLPKGHPLEGRGDISFEELKSEPFLVNKWGSLQLKSAIDSTGICPDNVSLLDYSRENLLINIRSGDYIGFFYASDLSYFSLTGLSAHRVTGVPCPPWVLMRNKNFGTDMVIALRDFILAAMPNIVMPNI